MREAERFTWAEKYDEKPKPSTPYYESAPGGGDESKTSDYYGGERYTYDKKSKPPTDRKDNYRPKDPHDGERHNKSEKEPTPSTPYFTSYPDGRDKERSQDPTVHPHGKNKNNPKSNKGHMHNFEPNFRQEKQHEKNSGWAEKDKPDKKQKKSTSDSHSNPSHADHAKVHGKGAGGGKHKRHGSESDIQASVKTKGTADEDDSRCHSVGSLEGNAKIQSSPKTKEDCKTLLTAPRKKEPKTAWDVTKF